ncbi:MAG: nucleotide exchange factor GrpE [Rhodospirillaceae bacterium]|jgi:molecular chaperone GrpE|nr:nucleotide exchange factor GrpE [Rhodospirillaceae bacterium]|tara:strand:+ start:822 stop:1580 length:759 start_codon:yes stop_codon:yes gene_type:complete
MSETQEQKDEAARAAADAEAHAAAEEALEATEEAEDDEEGTETEEAESEDVSDSGAEEDDPAAQIAELRDQLLRAMAETENVRRRAAREREEAAKYGIANFARDVLGIADNLRRAIDSAPPETVAEDNAKALFEGVEMTERELLAALERHGVKRLEPLGEKFDHNLHQAMFEVPDPSAAPGTVVQVMQPGYVLAERLLRPAMVGIAKAPAEAENEAAGEAETGEGKVEAETAAEESEPTAEGAPGANVDTQA